MFVEVSMNSTISFRRPEQLHVLSKLSVPPEADLASYVRRLQDLGYKIVDVSPPLEHWGPPMKSHQLAPELVVVEKGKDRAQAIRRFFSS